MSELTFVYRKTYSRRAIDSHIALGSVVQARGKPHWLSSMPGNSCALQTGFEAKVSLEIPSGLARKTFLGSSQRVDRAPDAEPAGVSCRWMPGLADRSPWSTCKMHRNMPLSGFGVEESLKQQTSKLRLPSRNRGAGIVLAVAGATSAPALHNKFADHEDFLKAGGLELEMVTRQASKEMEQQKIKDTLMALEPHSKILDLVVIGCGPAGLSLSAEAAKQGLCVGLIGPDTPFVNNYGVWPDEFAAIGYEHCIEQRYRDTAIYLETDAPVMVGRAYGRVGRDLLRNELLKRCAEAGVLYMDAEVESISDVHNGGSTVHCSNGADISCRLVTVAAGAASGKFLTYEASVKSVGVQTAYGIEVEVDAYPYDPSVMHFMDYRSPPGGELPASLQPEEFRDIPTFLYAMPVTPKRIFFEETCLAARPAMPFEVLKQRLHHRLDALGIKYSSIFEEEWSYIPVGGSLPHTTQRHLGFGAAASMIHPATGYSITRSLTEAPAYAAAIAAALRRKEGNSECDSQSAALSAWNCLWSPERKRQRAFMLFGLELIVQLDSRSMRDFFSTFFRLPEWLWKGFLGSTLSSADLLWFAFMTFVVAPNSLRYALIRHLLTDETGARMMRCYLGQDLAVPPPPQKSLPGVSPQAVQGQT